MSRILLLIETQRNRRQVEGFLSKGHEVIPARPDRSLEENFDLAIIDAPTLRKLRGEVEQKRRQQEPVLLPFLLMAQRRRGSTPIRHLGATVDDLILRPLDKFELNARVSNLLRMREMSLGLKKEHDLVLKLAVTDDVSGYHNTRYLHRYLDRFFGSQRAAEKELTLVFFDIDNFKTVVDGHGHLLGAKSLREVAQVVNRSLSPEDRIVRYGGDEFVVILPEQGKQVSLRKVDDMRRAIDSNSFLQKEGLDVRLTASFGLATYPEDASTKRELLGEADRCLFESKHRGKNRISLKPSTELSGEELDEAAESDADGSPPASRLESAAAFR
jgi:diguanylate cyclase (GGDEF)-like protein